MIGKRRVLSLLNESATFMTGVFILCTALYFFLFLFQIEEGFFAFFLKLLDALFYCEIALNALIMPLSVIFWISDYTFESGYFFKSIIRILINTVVYVIIQTVEIMVIRGLSIRI
ncbi:MAG: hypothetical protein K6F82_06210 [Sphaerochaetaceae bacterium]|nr:hypothetical protein [Sphaerochaetaceae bacterium]